MDKDNETNVNQLSDSSPPDVETIYNSLAKYPTPHHAIMEIVDNSGEYGPATTINIRYDEKRDCLVVADDGCGVDYHGMLNMFRFKSSEHAPGATGKFGYGFKAAECFLSTDKHSSRVISKQNNKFTMGNPKAQAEWRYPITPVPSCGGLSVKHLKICQDAWDEFAPVPDSPHGTIIMITVANPYTAKDLIKLKSLLATTYKNFYNQDIKISVNGERVVYDDIRGASLSEIGIDDWEDLEFTYYHNGRPVTFTISAFIHKERKGVEYSGFCIFRNGRLICNGGKLGVDNKILSPQASMRGFQIIIEGDAALDDVLNMQATKIVTKNQTIDPGFRDFLLNTGLKKVINKVYATGRDDKIQKTDLSHWKGILKYTSSLVNKHPNPMSHEAITGNTGKAAAPTGKSRGKTINKGKSNPGRNLVTPCLSDYKGVINIGLEPLGQDGPPFISDDRVYKSVSQLVIIFNSDVDFVRNLITEVDNRGGPASNAINYFKEAVSQEIALRDGTVDEEGVATYRKTQQLLYTHRALYASQQKSIRKKRSGNIFYDDDDTNGSGGSGERSDSLIEFSQDENFDLESYQQKLEHIASSSKRPINPIVVSVAEKDCNGCGTTHPASAFHKLRKSSDGLQPRCKECRKSYPSQQRKTKGKWL